jgi:hypothetical protein
MEKVLDVLEFIGGIFLVILALGFWFISAFYLLGRIIDCLFISKSPHALFWDILAIGYILWFLSERK